MKKNAGFTLIELMIAVVIVGILVAVAIPNYSEYVTRSRIPDATSGLASNRVRMEQFFQDNRTYVGAPACVEDDTTSTNFVFSCNGAATGTTYQLQAVGRGPMTGFTFTVDQNNAKTSAVPTGWTASQTCWVTRRSGQC